MDLEQAISEGMTAHYRWSPAIRMGTTINFQRKVRVVDGPEGLRFVGGDWVPVTLQSQAEVERYERWSGLVSG